MRKAPILGVVGYALYFFLRLRMLGRFLREKHHQLVVVAETLCEGRSKVQSRSEQSRSPFAHDR